MIIIIRILTDLNAAVDIRVVCVNTGNKRFLSKKLVPIILSFMGPCPP